MKQKVIRMTEEEFASMLTNMVTERLNEGLSGLAKMAGKIGNIAGGISKGFNSNGYSVGDHLSNVWKHVSNGGDEYKDFSDQKNLQSDEDKIWNSQSQETKQKISQDIQSGKYGTQQ